MKLTREHLINYFREGEKPLEQHKIGLEYELIGVLKDQAWTLPFDGDPGVEAILNNISINSNWSKCSENKRITELHREKESIFLEPGGQLELSSTPVQTLSSLSKELSSYIQTVLEASSQTDILWLALGVHPLSKLSDVSWIPKGRYKIMSAYFAQNGEPLAHLMMKQTASIQINIDYQNEMDAIKKFRLFMGLAPIFTAIFANSSIYEGKVTPYLSYRSHIWQHTDPQRCGLIKQVFDPNFSYEQYVDFILSVPMLFVKRENKWMEIKNMNFAQFMEKGFAGTEASIEDWELHLSTVFTESRLKQILELRGFDSHLPEMVMGASALVHGLIKSPAIIDAAWDLIKDWTWEQRLQLYLDVPKYGLRAQVKNDTIIMVANELIHLSDTGLKLQEKEQVISGERRFLVPVQELIDRGKTRAEESIDLFQRSQQQWLKNNEIRRNYENGIR